MKFSIRNFRSIQDAVIDLAPITVAYGPNGAGKSSILYSLLTFRNIIQNPNQDVNGFFNYGFVNLGNFEAVVFEHDVRKHMRLELSGELIKNQLTYYVDFGEHNGAFGLALTDEVDESILDLQLPITFPYPANGQVESRIGKFGVTWNGITALVQAEGEGQQETSITLAQGLNLLPEIISQIGVVPLKRGFSKPYYSAVPISPGAGTEDEVASLLSQDKYLVSKVSHYLEEILKRDFRVNVTPGTSIFSLDATDRRNGVASELVNEGFGVNQLVYLLTKVLHRNARLICIEEPEIHLHPTAIRALAKAFAEIAQQEQKTLVISTHSETLVVALLALIANNDIQPSNLAFYLVTKGARTTEFEHQSVNENGQLEGGLASFMAGEMGDVAAFLGTSE